MAVDYEAVTQIARDFAQEARKILPVNKAVLYGSYAKGNARDESDIDICFFLDTYGGRKRFHVLRDLVSLAYDLYKCKYPFEPTVLKTNALYNDNPFAKEILRTGVDLL
jgi:predicted nucleotidyltransferase